MPIRPTPAILLCALLLGPALHASETEEEPRLPAADLVLPALLAGPGYRVEPTASLHGYQARFTLHTDWGELQAESVEMLAIRIAEVPAMDATFAAPVSAMLAEAAQDAAMAPVRAVGEIVSRPVDTLVGLPMGTVRFFGDKVTRWGRRAGRLGDRIDQAVSHEGDPYRDPGGPMGATRLDVDAPARAWWEKPTREVTRAVRGEIGHRRARRELAERLGVDPYTTNPILSERLDRLAWMTASGGFASRQLVAVATAGAGEALGYSQDIQRLVLEASPEDLRERNRDVLTRHCSDEELVDELLDHRVFPPNLQTQLAELVQALGPRSGCHALLETALMAGNEVEARFVLNALRLVLHYGGEGGRGGSLLAHGTTLAYLTPSGEFLLPVPVDRLSWTPQMRDWFDGRLLNGHHDRTLLVSGAISPLAQQALTRQGWSLVAHLPYPGAPPYPASPAAPAGTAPR